MIPKKKYPLKNLRGLSGLTQSELAKKVGLTERTIGSYERNPDLLGQASYPTLKSLAGALEVSVDDIFLGDDSEIPKQKTPI